MATQLKLEDVEPKIIAIIAAALSGDNPDVRAISVRDFGSDGNLVLRSNRRTVLVLYDGTAFDPMKDNLRQNYIANQEWMALCFEQSLRSTEDERLATYGLTSEVCDAVAGQRLDLQDSTRTAPMWLLAVSPFQFDEKGTWFAVRFKLAHVAQYSDKS
jgi:hypothetical protein